MKKYLALIISIFLVAALFSGCGAKEPVASTPAQTPAVSESKPAKESREQEHEPQSDTTETDGDSEVTEASYDQPDDEYNENEYDYRNPALAYEVPQVYSDRSFLVSDWDGTRILLTLPAPVGPDYNIYMDQEHSWEKYEPYGCIDGTNSVAFKYMRFGATGIAFKYFVSDDEFYDVSITTERDAAGDSSTKLGEKGDWEFFDTVSNVSPLFDDSVQGVLPYIDPSSSSTQALVIEVAGNGDNADPLRALNDLFEVTVLHNQNDPENYDVSYTLDGKPVDTSKAMTSRDVVGNTLRTLGFTIPEGAMIEETVPDDGNLLVTVGDNEYYFSFELEERGHYRPYVVLEQDTPFLGAYVTDTWEDGTWNANFDLEPNCIVPEAALGYKDMVLHVTVMLTPTPDAMQDALNQVITAFGLDG